ncbi:MAG: hypothetical protein MJZ89_03885 [Paludibacteraceae bacterium]|nr:hypothetical protein [Paludibacteraceae bacterium]
MKKLLIILFAITALMSCDTRAPYITTDTPLHFEASEVMGTQMSVTAWAEDDRAYYYFDLLEKDFLESIGLNDEHLETLILDKLYQNYLDWRFNYLVENEEYIASFESRTFYHGTAKRFFFNLTPSTEYVMFGFCVNPDNIQKPIGRLYRQPVTTTPVQYDVSPMVIDIMVDVDSSCISAWFRPSVNGHATKEPYICGFVSDSELEFWYHGNIKEYVDAQVKEITAEENTDLVKERLRRDIYGEGSGPYMYNQGYWFVAAAYRISYAHALYTRHFVATPGLHLDYGHDEKTDYSQD